MIKDLPPEFSLDSLKDVGFQATNLGRAIEIYKEAKKENALTFFAFTANLVASGLRGLIREMVKERLVDIIITTAGAIEHDIMKSFKSYELSSFHANDEKLREEGKNRIGNILVNDEHYILFESFIQQVFEECLEEDWLSAKKVIEKMMEKAREDSFLYWCKKNGIAVYVPGIIDGAIGLNLYFFSKKKRKKIRLDILDGMEELVNKTINAEKTFAIILGGGIAKHFTIGMNILREGLDYAIYFTTATPYDGSLSGAEAKEAISWKKIKGKHSTVIGDATITFPIFFRAIREK